MRLAVLAGLTLGLLLAGTAGAPDSDGDTIEDATEQSLATRFAPLLTFAAGEVFFPTRIEYFLGASDLKQVGGGTVISSPTAAELETLTNPADRYYLDHRAGSPAEPGGIEADYRASAAATPTVYARVTPAGGATVVQYWFFYAFNSGPLNNHEGDWEMVEVLVEGSTATAAAYSQHHSGERVDWALVETVDDHPRVYVARGSHANYFRSFEGRLDLANDAVGGGTAWTTADFALVLLGERDTHPSDQGWLAFAGSWGDYGNETASVAGERGPEGPAYREGGLMWTDPAGWANGLRAADKGWLDLNWWMANLFWVILLVLLLPLALTLARAFALHRKTGLGLRLHPFFRWRTMGRGRWGLLLAIAGLALTFLGYVLPWYSIFAATTAGPVNTHGAFVEVLRLNGVDGLQVNFLLSGQGLVQLFSVPVPVGLLLLIGSALFVVRWTGVLEARKLGRRFGGKAFGAILPVLLILIVVAQMANIASLAPREAQPEIRTVLQQVASSPWGGASTESLGTYGSVSLAWGMGLGAYLLIAACVVFAAAAALVLTGPTEALALAPAAPVQGSPLPPPGPPVPPMTPPPGPPWVPPSPPPPPVAAPPFGPPPASAAASPPSPPPRAPPGPVGALCPRCGSVSRPDAKFCGSCGRPM